MTNSIKAVTDVLDAHWSAVKSKDADAVIALVTDDFLSCGSDPDEFWNKTEMYTTVKQIFANTDLVSTPFFLQSKSGHFFMIFSFQKFNRTHIV